MKYSDYKNIGVKDKLLKVVALEMKIKKYFVNFNAINAMDKDLGVYVIGEMISELKELKKELSKIQN